MYISPGPGAVLRGAGRFSRTAAGDPYPARPASPAGHRGGLEAGRGGPALTGKGAPARRRVGEATKGLASGGTLATPRPVPRDRLAGKPTGRSTVRQGRPPGRPGWSRPRLAEGRGQAELRGE